MGIIQPNFNGVKSLQVGPPQQERKLTVEEFIKRDGSCEMGPRLSEQETFQLETGRTELEGVASQFIKTAQQIGSTLALTCRSDVHLSNPLDESD